MGKKISELTNRQQLSGNEDLPFQEGQDNGSITIHSLNEYISNSNVNQTINQIKQAEQQAISNFSSQKVSPEMLSESTKQLINASGGGTITNLADDEDIESVGQDLKVLKFADRTYNPVAHIGRSIGSKWEEFDDELLYKPYIRTKGTFAQKPLSSQGIQQGFSYFCTDKQTVEGSRSGIMIYYAGNDTWIDALGRYV